MSRNSRRNYTIFTEYSGLNQDQQRVPAIVLAHRYGLTRGRIYQIVAQQRAKVQSSNPRVKYYNESIERDAEAVSSMLKDFLEARG
jgi:predicted outer membrane protein|tara:strand:+ start:2031 stop:2288 length:258 start_codon:yes stop_codon:yes gene_type:complete